MRVSQEPTGTDPLRLMKSIAAEAAPTNREKCLTELRALWERLQSRSIEPQILSVVNEVSIHTDNPSDVPPVPCTGLAMM
jgi:hypothetical protein